MANKHPLVEQFGIWLWPVVIAVFAASLGSAGVSLVTGGPWVRPLWHIALGAFVSALVVVPAMLLRERRAKTVLLECRRLATRFDCCEWVSLANFPGEPDKLAEKARVKRKAAVIQEMHDFLEQRTIARKILFGDETGGSYVLLAVAVGLEPRKGDDRWFLRMNASRIPEGIAQTQVADALCLLARRKEIVSQSERNELYEWAQDLRFSDAQRKIQALRDL